MYNPAAVDAVGHCVDLGFPVAERGVGTGQHRAGEMGCGGHDVQSSQNVLHQGSMQVLVIAARPAVAPGGDNKLPFGNYPRLLLAWVSTEAVRTQSRVIVLGSSLAKFMRELGVYSSGGREGTKLRTQMRRLFDCTVQLTYNDMNVERFVRSPIAARGEYWWNEHKPDQPSLWDSKIELGEDFFNEIINHPMPINRAIGAPNLADNEITGVSWTENCADLY